MTAQQAKEVNDLKRKLAQDGIVMDKGSVIENGLVVNQNDRIMDYTTNSKSRGNYKPNPAL